MINDDFLDKRVEEALASPMSIRLPEDFAYRITRKIELRDLAMDNKIHNISLIASVFFTAVSLLLLIVILNDSFLSGLKNWSGWAVTFGVLVFIFQLIENKLLKKKTLSL